VAFTNQQHQRILKSFVPIEMYSHALNVPRMFLVFTRPSCLAPPQLYVAFCSLAHTCTFFCFHWKYDYRRAYDCGHNRAVRDSICRATSEEKDTHRDGDDSDDGDDHDSHGHGGVADNQDPVCAENVLRQSIQALSCILDAKLVQLMEETDCEVNLGSPQCKSLHAHILISVALYFP
jgi:hypothetical protein